MVTILIAGYHGFGNCGDEAILRAMVTSFRRMADDIDIVALSNDPDFTKKEYNIDITNELPQEKFDATIMAVAHNEFQNLNIDQIGKDRNVIYDVKWLFKEADGRL